MRLINSLENKEVKYAASLLQKKYRDREKRFLVEGLKSIEAAGPHLLEAVFIDNDRVNDCQRIIETPGINCYAVDKRIIKKICDTDTPQGIVAIAKQPVVEMADLLKTRGLLVLLDRITDPGNMGTIIRSAWAFEAGGVLISAGSVDPFSPKVVRSTMGGIFNVPLALNIDQSQIEFFQKQGYKLVCTDIRASQNFYDIDYNCHQIIVIGNEAAGVSEYIKNISDELIKIPVNPTADSLNAAVACAIIMQEAH
jgi:TrmH family RNA methyltransferase